jgi:hypothetical protein
MSFLHADPTDLEGTGLAIVQAISGAVTYYPCLTIGNDVIVDQPIVIGSGGGALDALGDSSIDGDTIAEWLSVEVLSPGQDPAVSTRVIFDRVDPAQRASGTIDLSSITQVDLVDVPEVGAVFAPTLDLMTFSVAVAPTPIDHLIHGPNRQDPISLIASLAQALPLLHDDLSARLSGELGYRSFPDAPNVTAITGRLDRPTDPDSTMSVLTDMLHRSVATLPLADREATAHPGLVSGALAHAAERVLTDPAALGELANGAGLDQRIGPSVGAIFAEAARQSIPTRTLLPVVGTMTLRTLDASDRAKVGMRAALDAGYVVVVPERWVDLGDGPMTGWWLIDPRSGFTVDQLETGGSATLIEYAERIATYVYGPLQKFRTLGCAVTFAAMAAAIVSAVGATVQLKEAQNAGGAVTGAFISFAGNLVGATGGLLAPIAGCD